MLEDTLRIPNIHSEFRGLPRLSPHLLMKSPLENQMIGNKYKNHFPVFSPKSKKLRRITKIKKMVSPLNVIKERKKNKNDFKFVK